MSARPVNVQLLVLTGLFVALTAVGAFLKIPTASGVAITLQLLFTFLAGILLGPGWGSLSQLVYVLLGLAGVPVFTAGGGFGYVLQPSFGFLLGLIPCAAVTGAVARAGRKTVLRIVLACLAGWAVLYAVGLPYMAAVLNIHLKKGLDFAAVMKIGMLLYLPGDALKIAATVILSKALLPVVARVRR